MYQAPALDRTEAWKPSFVMSARTVAVGSSTPLPRKVAISGCFAPRPASKIGEFVSSKRWKPPVGVGRWTMSARSFAALESSRGAVRRSRASWPLLRVQVVSSSNLSAAGRPLWVFAGLPLTRCQASWPRAEVTWSAAPGACGAAWMVSGATSAVSRKAATERLSSLLDVLERRGDSLMPGPSHPRAWHARNACPCGVRIVPERSLPGGPLHDSQRHDLATITLAMHTARSDAVIDTVSARPSSYFSPGARTSRSGRGGPG